jgi:L-fucose mutarotase
MDTPPAGIYNLPGTEVSMLKMKLLHPEILDALGRAGHGAHILIADGNYPFSTGSPPAARKVFLNLAPGKLSVTDVLAVLGEAIPIEAATVMVPPDGAAQPIFAEFRGLLPAGLELTPLKRFEFYDMARSANTALVIATGEQRRFANILLTIGVVKD